MAIVFTQRGQKPSCRRDFHFEPRADTIASADKPVVKVLLSFGTTCIEFRFATDQSCLGLEAVSLCVRPDGLVPSDVKVRG